MSAKETRIPVSVILAAADGDEKALDAVVRHYKDYIQALSLRTLHDDYGNEYYFVDDDIRLRLETKLIHSIMTDFKPLTK